MEPKFLRVEEVAQELSVSKPYAYKLIRQLNEELKAKGFITISGRINREYFNERLYGARKPANKKSSPKWDLLQENWQKVGRKKCSTNKPPQSAGLKREKRK